MKVRNSFLIRWLFSVNETENEKSLLDVEHIQSGDKFRTNSIDELSQWMKSINVKSVNTNEFSHPNSMDSISVFNKDNY